MSSGKGAPEQKKAVTESDKMAEALFVAVGNNQMAIVDQLLEKGARTDWQHGRHTPMRLAVQRCLFPIVRTLHERANVSIRDDPLLMHFAALGQIKNKQLLEYLVERGGYVNSSDETLGTPLMLALFGEEHDEQFARWIIEMGADVTVQQTGAEKSSALHRAVQRCSIDMVRLLLDKGAVSLLSTKDARGLTPLMHAAEQGRDDVLELFLTEHSVSPNDNTSGFPPLFLATQNGHYAAAKLLLEAGADANVKDDENECAPLHLAASNAHLALMKLLLQYGADPNVVEKRSLTPLIMAASEGLLAACKILIEAGADVNVQSNEGRTAAHHAVMANAPWVFALLTQSGADMEIKDNEGHTPLGMVKEAKLGHMANAFLHADVIDVNDPKSVCNACMKPMETPRRCSRCKKTYYCTAECQKAHWVVHKSVCVKT